MKACDHDGVIRDVVHVGDEAYQKRQADIAAAKAAADEAVEQAPADEPDAPLE
jgi:hypothetical protein